MSDHEDEDRPRRSVQRLSVQRLSVHPGEERLNLRRLASLQVGQAVDQRSAQRPPSATDTPRLNALSMFKIGRGRKR